MEEMQLKGLWYDPYPHSYFFSEPIKLKDPKTEFKKKKKNKQTKRKKEKEKEWKEPKPKQERVKNV